MALYLFDIDMTLIDAAGAGREAMELAFVDLLGIENALEHMGFAGRTDTYIVGKALADHGRADIKLEEFLPDLVNAYVSHLRTILPNRPARVLPGVHELVAALGIVPGTSLGVATGNFRAAAQFKLDHFGLSTHLREGGYGEDSADRSVVVAQAVRRLTDHPRDVETETGPIVVIGDTPYDVSSAQDNGCRSVAVATGFSSYDELAAAGADLVFKDFSDREKVFVALLQLAGIELR